VTVTDIENQGYSGLDLKMLYYTAHYRSFLDFNDDVLSQARKQRENIIKKLSKLEYKKLSADNYLELESQLTTSEAKTLLEQSMEGLLDDLNTSKVLAAINKALHNPSSEISSVIYRLDQKLLRLDLFNFKDVGEITNLPLEISQEIKDLSQKRREAKQNKDRATADKIRDELKSK
jgi:cysteinyl-tRNA synthetase